MSIFPGRALADDTSEIQARVTANLRSHGVQDPGLFSQYTVVQDGPYAWVSAGLGARGYGSETFVLSKKSGHWMVLLSGGGLAGTSEFVAVGIPYDVALKLERTTCSDPDYRSFAVKVRHTRLNAALVRAALMSGTSALPSRTIEIVDDRTSRAVAIYPPLDFKSCTLDSAQ
jgi:hypothetical protein